MLSRIGASPIKIDEKHEISINGSQVKIVFKNKEYFYNIDKRLYCEFDKESASIRLQPNMEKIRSKADEREVRKIAGFHVRDMGNLLSGLLNPFKSDVEIIGTGYKVSHNKQEGFLLFSLGYSHDIIVSIPSEIAVDVAQNKIVLRSSSKMILGAFVNYLHLSLRKFDKFKGKGVIPVGRYLQRKEIKKKK